MRILSIDGGGMNGIITAVVLRRLEELLAYYSQEPDARISDYFDIVAGTSTGAIMTGLYLCPDEQGRARFSASDVINLYTEHGSEIFKKKKFYPINTLFGLLSSRYTNRPFDQMLTKYFGTLSLKQLTKPCLISSYNTMTGEAVFFNSIDEKTKDYLVKDVILASTAAPTYFPSIMLPDERSQDCCYIDGGVVANNPAMCALVEALKLDKDKSLEDIFLVSVGNIEECNTYRCKDVSRWGIVRWAIPVFTMISNASEQTVDYTLRNLFGVINLPEHYVRIKLSVQEDTPSMDDTSTENLQRCLQYGRILTKQSEKKLHQIAIKLVKG